MQLFLIIQRLLLPIRFSGRRSSIKDNVFAKETRTHSYVLSRQLMGLYWSKYLFSYLEGSRNVLCWRSSDDPYVIYTNCVFQKLLTIKNTHPAIRTLHLKNQTFSWIHPIAELCKNLSFIQYYCELLDRNNILPPNCPSIRKKNFHRNPFKFEQKQIFTFVSIVFGVMQPNLPCIFRSE